MWEYNMILEKIHKDLNDKGITNRQLATMFDTNNSKINELFARKREFDFDFNIYNEILNMRLWCKTSLKLGHTGTTTLKMGHDQYGKPKFVQMETLSA
ncbi:hypothetical protein CON63_27400 [Bacillus toyonensis]|nr:hypothetical protein [Bacillus toyonensis biovar Thuringiensis]PED17174.1 hypothetical protein CON63_27400 [Bacillus toyonensis]PEM85308.1 hypothetical protein CN629_26325 [Bacillus toyonensis]